MRASCRREGGWVDAAGHVDGKEDTEDGSGGIAGAGAEADGSSLLFNEATGDPETEAGADGLLGGEEGGEDSIANLGGDAGAVVRDEDGYVVAGTLEMAAADVEVARFGDGGEGLDGVDDEVGEDLAHFSSQAVDAEIGVEVEGAVDLVGAHLAGEEIDDAVDELVEDDLAGEGGIAVEAEGLLGDLGDPGEFGVGGFGGAVERDGGRRGRYGRDR